MTKIKGRTNGVIKGILFYHFCVCPLFGGGQRSDSHRNVLRDLTKNSSTESRYVLFISIEML